MATNTDAAAVLDAQTETALAELLPRRQAHRRVGVLGAGSDDLDSGRAYLGQLAAGGYAVPTWPVEHGGMGLQQSEADVVRGVLRRFEAPDMYPFMVGLDLIGPTILVYATPEQQARWLPRIRSGEDIWCQMFSEPDAGSDLAGLKARARRDGEGWRVSGAKVWTSRCPLLQVGVAPGAPRSIRSQACRHHRIRHRHDRAGGDRASLGPDERGRPFQRGLPR